MTGFRILSLPTLALQATLELLDPFELFNLSQCSRKSAQIVPIGGSKKYEMVLAGGRSGRILINQTYTFKVVSMKHFKRCGLIGTRMFPIDNGNIVEVHMARHHKKENRRIFFFDDSFFGRQIVIFHLAKVFGCNVKSIDTGRKLPTENFRKMIEWTIEKQQEIRELNICSQFISENDLKFALDSLPVLDSCSCTLKTSSEFQYEFKTHPKALSVFKSHWFNLKNLLAAAKSCIVIHLTCSKLSNEDIDVFLKSWTNGGFPNLQFMQVLSDNFNKKDKILGRKPTRMKNPTEGARKEREILNHIVGIHSGLRIQAIDGAEAEVKMKLDRFGDEFIFYKL